MKFSIPSKGIVLKANHNKEQKFRFFSVRFMTSITKQKTEFSFSGIYVTFPVLLELHELAVDFIIAFSPSTVLGQ
jgi:hypothetical protein